MHTVTGDKRMISLVKKKAHRGFTLVELLIVVIILAIFTDIILT